MQSWGDPRRHPSSFFGNRLFQLVEPLLLLLAEALAERVAQVDLADLLVADDVLGRALGDDLALVKT